MNLRSCRDFCFAKNSIVNIIVWLNLNGVVIKQNCITAEQHIYWQIFRLFDNIHFTRLAGIMFLSFEFICTMTIKQ